MNSKDKLVVITQPDFFPWLGAFDKFVRCDAFVFLDNVTNRPNDGIWTKRVKIVVNGLDKWLSVPLKKTDVEFVPISEMRVDWESDFSKKHLSTIENNYRKAPHFKEVFPFVEKFYASETPFIAKRNSDFILDILSAMEIKKEVYFASQMDLTTKRNQLLIDIVKLINGTAYLYGKGSLGYLEFDLWERNDIEVVPQDYVHPEYNQFNTTSFIPGLSILDALFNIGLEKTKNLLRNDGDKKSDN